MNYDDLAKLITIAMEASGATPEECILILESAAALCKANWQELQPKTVVWEE